MIRTKTVKDFKLSKGFRLANTFSRAERASVKDLDTLPDPHLEYE